MTVRIYKSTNSSAPTLTGQTGSLVALLDAVLVNGYGSQTAAGWTIAYTTTSKRVYTMASGGTGFSIYVDDSGPGAGSYREARATGYVSPTGIGTGTGLFPATTQMTNGTFIRKSATADSTTRAWTVVADGHTLYLFAETGDGTAQSYPFMFGDFFTYGSSDLSNCIIIGRTTENSASAVAGGTYSQTGLIDAFGHLSNMNTTGLSNLLAGHYVAASYTGVGGSIQVGKHADLAKMGSNSFMQCAFLGQWTQGSSGSSTSFTSEFSYPNGPDTGLYVSPIWVHHNGNVRGYLKGLWCPLQHMPINHNDTYSGTGLMLGKSILAQNILGLSNNVTGGPTHTNVQVHIETSDTWT